MFRLIMIYHPKYNAMKKLLVSLSILVSCTYSSHAQVKDTAFAMVKYNFLWVRDSTDPKDVTAEMMALYLGKNVSGYRSLDRIAFDSIMREQAVQQEANFKAGLPINVNMSGVKPGSTDAIFKYTETGKIDHTERVLKTYIIEEPLPVINWSITQETKDIQGLSCQKATARFRGRNYTAWFSSALPYSNGPWKLSGLPGLILEASDDKKEVVFEFAGFEDVSNRNIPIAFPANVVRASAKEVKQLQEAMAADPQGFMRSQMAGSGITVRNTVTGSPMPGANVKRKIFNNPIEKTAD